MPREIPLAEVARHNSPESLWMVINDDIYDVTAFLHEHPGGEDSLLENAGVDATQAFEDVGHSIDARELMKKYKIGTLPPSEYAHTVMSCAALSQFGNQDILVCAATSCPRVTDRKDDRTWRTFDGTVDRTRQTSIRKDYKGPQPARQERRVDRIVCSRERSSFRRQSSLPPEDSSSSNLKWAILALAGALVIGIALKKYMG